MRVIVTGANGFIGKFVCKELTTQSHDVIAMDRKSGGLERDLCQQIEVDFTDSDVLLACASKIKKADVLVHLAADITVPGDKVTIANNIGITQNVLELSKQVGVQHFIFLSSIPVIGRPITDEIDENHPVHPVTPYHWSKYLSEKMLECYKDDFVTTILRIPSPIGVGMRSTVFLSVLLQKMLHDNRVELYGDGKRIQNYIDVRDIAYAVCKSITARAEGLFLIAGEKSISNIELAKLCKRISGSLSEINIGRYDDAEDSLKWIISGKRARSCIGFKPQYSLEDTVYWIYDNMK